jgi:hypothetical protein
VLAVLEKHAPVSPASTLSCPEAFRFLETSQVTAVGAAIGVQFNVVFDAEDLSKLAGPPFANTQFFRELK